MKKIAARDGAYDKRYVYRMTSRLVIHPATPTRKNARYDQKGDWGVNRTYRNRAVFTSRVFRSDSWKEQVNYHQRSFVETATFRIERLFEGTLKNRTLKINGVKQR